MTEPTTTAPAPQQESGSGEPISWLELFFDLVVIAGIAVLSEALREDPTWGGLGMYLLLFGALWMTWVSVVLYADVAGAKTRVRSVLIAMFLVALMAATAPSHFEARANVFAVAFLLVRAMIARQSLATGRLVASWPLLQFGGFSLPWVVAMWVDSPAKYWLWALGLVLDLAMVVFRGEEMVTRQLDQAKQFQSTVETSGRPTRPGGRAGGGRRGAHAERMLGLTHVEINREHLEERLGTFMIIVLGEAVTQLVVAAARTPWTNQFITVVVAGFLVLVGLWQLTFSFGFASAPHTRLATMPARFGLPMHLLSTLGILLLAAGLAELAGAPDDRLHGMMLGVTCGGLALFFLISLVGGLTARAPRLWLLGWALPCTLYPIALALLGAHLSGVALTWLLLVPVAWQCLYAWRRSSAPR